MNAKKKYDSTVARIAGNLLSGVWDRSSTDDEQEVIVEWAVSMARAIVAEVERTEPQSSETE